MSENLITFIVFIIAGIFWVVKQVYEYRARQDANIRRRENSQPSILEDDDEYSFEEFEIVRPPSLAPAPSPEKNKPATPVLSEPVKVVSGTKNRYARMLRENTMEAIVMQEILGPPKALRRH